MIENNNIICFGFAEWDNPYKTNQHHIMQRLSEKNKVLFIESLGLRRPTLQKKDMSRIIKRLIKFAAGVRKVTDGLFIVSPLVIPFHKYWFIRQINRALLSWQLDSAIKKYRFDKPIIWSYIPNAIEFLGKWNEKLVVYHCVDEISANPLIPGDVIKQMERDFIRKADAVFVTAKPLFEEKIKFSDKVYYMPNVADYGHFSGAVKEDTAIPEELAQVVAPRLGFIGALSAYKLDMELLAYIAERHPIWSIVLIGETGEGEQRADLSRFEKLKNIHILGGRPYKSLPGYIKGFNVCLLPNCINDYTRNMFPMKFFEYLASGKPVVSTMLEALGDFKGLGYFSLNHEEFEKNIESALIENDPVLRAERVKAARKFTWEIRIEEMSAIICREII
jgi:glycosyltransferase involved in cell wall biosynthesis